MTFAAFSPLNYSILGVYMFSVLLVGFLCTRKSESAEEYFLAGRNMPALVVAMSMFASLTSAVTFMGVPQIAYSDNVSVILGVAVSPIVAPILITLFYPVYWKNKVTTSYDYIALRFGERARHTASGMFILARLGWLGTVIYAPSLALNISTGIPVKLAILLMGAVATVYTIFGGLKAVLWTDVLQFIVLVGGAIWIALGLGIEQGFANVIRASADAGKFDIFHFGIDFTKMTAVSAMVSFFLIFTHDYGVDQITVQRLISVKSFRGLSGAVIFNSIVDVVINALLLFIGLGLFVKYAPSALPDGINGAAILPWHIVSSLPDGISGVMIAGIFAAAMSSMDSGLNSISTVIVNDFSRNPKKSDKAKVQAGRWLTLVFGIFATVAAFYAGSIGHIVKAWSSFMALFAAPLLALFVLGLLVKKARFIDWLIVLPLTMSACLLLQKTQLHWIYIFPFSAISQFSVSLIAGAARRIFFR
ncbi:MAG: sodium/solute symporter [Phycisphaerae bacterium]|jgi:SSS family transporter